MNRLQSLGLGALALLSMPLIAALAQVNPQSLPANTVYGRLGIGSGPGQAIPFAALGAQLNSTASIAGSGDVTISGTIGAATTALTNIPNDTTLALDLLATNAVAPTTPASGKTRIYVDSTGKVLSAKNDAGTVSVTVVPNTSSPYQLLTGINTGGVPQVITIDGQTLKASPAGTDEILIWDVSGAAFKKATVSGVGTSSGVGSVGGATGAITLGSGLKMVGNQVNASQFPNNNNAEFLVWQAGTTFSGLTTGTVTSDHSVNGPGSGGTFTVTQSTLSATTRANILTNPTPRFAKRLVWSVAPTSGEGRTGYTGYFTAEEERDDDVTKTYGQTITVSGWVWVDGGTSPFYLFASQGMGVSGTSGLTGTGNTISGTGAGVDYSHNANEILYRSAQLTATTTPQLFSATFALNACSPCSPQSDNTFEIGAGMDFSGVANGEGMYFTLLRYDYGSSVLPWNPLPDANVYEAAQYNYQEFGVGTTCVVLATTQITCYFPFRSVMKPVGPIYTLLGSTPIFTCGTATAATIASSTTDQNGGYAVINGFSGLTVGSVCPYSGTGHFMSATRQ